MEMYCREAGLPYTEDMLTWEPKVFPDWKQYPKYYIWHENVTSSTGFKPKKAGATEVTLLPEFLKAVEKAIPYYERLNSVRRVPQV